MSRRKDFRRSADKTGNKLLTGWTAVALQRERNLVVRLMSSRNKSAKGMRAVELGSRGAANSAAGRTNPSNWSGHSNCCVVQQVAMAEAPFNLLSNLVRYATGRRRRAMPYRHHVGPVGVMCGRAAPNDQGRSDAIET